VKIRRLRAARRTAQPRRSCTFAPLRRAHDGQTISGSREVRSAPK
jgi:hypothetical protein